MASSKAAQKLFAIAKTWPVDPFRPNIQLKNFLQSLSTHPRLTEQIVIPVQALRDNTIQTKYPLSKKTLEPASMPKHYTRVVQGYENSAKGTGRSWWQIFFGVWR
ncbi:hypothetical protein CONPUDRAFT_63320 [Coniophora puteana RWD-64-598 SS2]|uniref:Uncharacterized protein n=1 Tax=Coniophora puteana (strain RWD-64-598) TaxID=741705 RepID=A0A5M3MBR8_CONPW|nr:uncharacterized protein CONPUDRAFT_63320 [Coniophora puteana RWD-64-598 SS2]EIW76678.1 hypothetical protein CONPUDRAFT_63320 [Coniophora puteana RWD-64-598 SS2]